MLELKKYIERQKMNQATARDRDDFKTLGFDPRELQQLKDMSTNDLTGLMWFCGIHVFNGVPLLVMTDDEKRMAYLAWRVQRINEKKQELAPKVERGIRWANYLTKAVSLIAR